MPQPHPNPFTARAYSINAAGALGYALHLSNGFLAIHPLTIITAIALFGLMVISVSMHDYCDQAISIQRLPLLTGVGWLSFYYIINITTAPTNFSDISRFDFSSYRLLLSTSAIIAFFNIIGANYFRRLQIPALLISFIITGSFVIHSLPEPNIDVYIWHTLGYKAFANGISPWSISIPNIYGHGHYYAAGLHDGSHVFRGYPYPPIAFILGGIGHYIFGDYRYANLAALAISCGLMIYLHRSNETIIAAALLMFSPVTMFVLHQGWTEPLSILGISFAYFCAIRSKRTLPYAFGLMMGIKQYFILATPLIPLLIKPTNNRDIFMFLAEAMWLPLLITLPFLAWSPIPFIDSVITFQFEQPFRPDSLSILALISQDGISRVPLNISFFMIGIPIALALAKSPRTPAGFMLSFAITLLFFFIFAKQAFCNYYFLAFGCLCWSSVLHSSSNREI